MTKEERLNGIKRAMLKFNERAYRKNQRLSRPGLVPMSRCPQTPLTPLERKMATHCAACGAPVSRHP